MKRLIVDIGEHRYTSRDQGGTWEHSDRPDRPASRPIDPAGLPELGARSYWLWRESLANGFGIAISCEPVKTPPEGMRYVESLAHVFVTEDGGDGWREIDLAAGLSPEALAELGSSWPPESIGDLFLFAPGSAVLMWEDPWLYDWPDMHVIHSRDRGERWGYAKLDQPCPVIAVTPGGELLAFNSRLALESADRGASWTRFEHRVQWPDGYAHEEVPIPRHPVFTGPREALALVVHWPKGELHHCTPDIGLVTSSDGARTWRHLHVFDNPDETSVNTPGVLALAVE